MYILASLSILYGEIYNSQCMETNLKKSSYTISNIHWLTALTTSTKSQLLRLYRFLNIALVRETIRSVEKRLVAKRERKILCSTIIVKLWEWERISSILYLIFGCDKRFQTKWFRYEYDVPINKQQWAKLLAAEKPRKLSLFTTRCTAAHIFLYIIIRIQVHITICDKNNHVHTLGRWSFSKTTPANSPNSCFYYKSQFSCFLFIS